MKPKMLVLDIDGTLTNTQKEITPATLQALRKLQEAGHIIVLASGRPPAGIRQVTEVLHLEETGGYVLAFNGARILDCQTQELLFHKELPHRYLPALYAAAVRHHLTIFTYQDEYAIAGTDANDYARFEVRINQMKMKRVNDFVHDVTFPIDKCLMSGEPENVGLCEEELLQTLGGELGIYKSEDFFLEITAQGVDKGTSVERLADMLHLKREQIVCCGDGYNDISMIQYAGVGVAMENAKEVVKQAADVVTASNDKDGLVPVIERLFLKDGEEHEAE